MSDSARLTPAVPAGPDNRPEHHPGRGARTLGYLAMAGIGAAIVIMIAASVVRQDFMRPPLVMPHPGPPWELTGAHVDPVLIITGLWLAALLGGAGVVAGLLAASRGARPPMRVIAVTAVVALVALTVLPPAGSSDSLDYADYGRLLVLGHNPYVATPSLLRMLHDVFARSIPVFWQHQVSLYGPFATLEQYLAARLGGTSPARVVFWLKLWNSGAFAVVALALDRLLRGRPAQRLRAHLLWTLNPLLLWDLIAAGHVDVVAAAAGLAGLLAIGRQDPAGQVRPRLARVLAAGILVGVAADIKIDYLLFAVGLAWALRRWPAALATAGAGALAVMVPTYAAFGTPALRALLAARDHVSADTIYQFIWHDPGHVHVLAPLAGLAVLALAALLLRRLPPGDRMRPALRPALALSLAWLSLWPYQLPWYYAIVICVLALYPASRLDWIVLAPLTFATIANMPGNPHLPRAWLRSLDRYAVHYQAPLVLLAAAGSLVVLAAAREWGVRTPRPPGRPAAAGSAEVDAGVEGEARDQVGGLA
jgi:hypothetical protein